MPFPVWRNRFRIFFFFSGEMEEIKKSIWIPIESTRVGFNLIIFFFLQNGCLRHSGIPSPAIPAPMVESIQSGGNANDCGVE